jgi:ribose transport system substrate-binding protein
MKVRVARGGIGVSALLASSLILAACSSGDTTDAASGAASSGAAGGDPKEVTLILGTSSDDFYKAIECGAKLQSEATGVQLTVQGAGQFDPALQVPIVDAVTASKPDAIIIAPTDDTALFAPLKAAVDGGSQLVLVDTTLKDASIAAGHIGSDYVLYGKQGAEQIAALTGGKGSVLGIFSPPGVSTNDLGRQGFTEGLAAYPDIEVLPFEYSSGEAGKSAAIVNAALAAHPDLAGIFTFNGGDSQGVVTALREANASDRVNFVSGDGQPFQVEQLKAGLVKALVIQQARTMGKLSIDYALKAIAGEDVPDETALPTVVGNLDNLSTPEVADNLYAPC